MPTFLFHSKFRNSFLLIVVCLGFRHLLKLKLSIARGKKARNETLFSSGQIYFLLMDCLIVLPHPSFMFDGKFSHLRTRRN